MNYKKYIELGFTRTDMNDSVEYDQTGFGGFCLEKEFKRGFSISVSSGELGSPQLYIKKQNSDNYHIVKISTECVIDMCFNNGKNN